MTHTPSSTADGSAATDAGGGFGTPAFSPLYQQIKSLILQSLQSGEWKPGETIPSEMDLATRFRVRQGKGTFVATHAEQQVQYRFLKLMPDVGDLDQEGPAQRTIIECKRVRANAEISRALALRGGDPVVQVRRVLAFGGVATILEDLWLPGAAFKGLTAERLADYHGPTYAMFELEFGVRMVRAEEKIRAVMPDEGQMQLLGLQQTMPLLSVERVAYTYNDVPMELRRGLYRTDTHHYHNELN